MPNLAFTCGASQAAIVPCGGPMARIRVCLSLAGTRSRPTARSNSLQSLDGIRTTFLPSLCHWPKYIQWWPLNGCENRAVGNPTSIS